MGYMDMLTKFFKSNQGAWTATTGTSGKVLPQASCRTGLFAWVNQWSVMVKSRPTLAFRRRYELPR